MDSQNHVPTSQHAPSSFSFRSKLVPIWWWLARRWQQPTVACILQFCFQPPRSRVYSFSACICLLPESLKFWADARRLQHTPTTTTIEAAALRSAVNSLVWSWGECISMRVGTIRPCRGRPSERVLRYARHVCWGNNDGWPNQTTPTKHSVDHDEGAFAVVLVRGRLGRQQLGAPPYDYRSN